MAQLKTNHAYMYAEIQAAAEFIRGRIGLASGESVATIGLVLGSGLGHVGDLLADSQGGVAIPYNAIPHFPTSTVVGHKGRLVFGRHEDTPVVVLQGRVHLYEGYSAAAAVFPIRVLLALGVSRVILTNAAGGLAEGMVPGDLMLISDHLNLTGTSPLLGVNDERLGPRFPDMTDTYTSVLRDKVIAIADSLSIQMKEGVYAGLLGPSYETPAEIGMLRTLGADAVGMSTVLEAIAASHGGAEIVGISCITNLAAGISEDKLSHAEVKETATRVEDAFAGLVLAIAAKIGSLKQ